MGFDNGRLEFNRPNLVYIAGEVIYGKLIFDQNKVKTFRGIYAKLKGKCEVRWTTTRTTHVNGKTRRHTVEHTSHETYCNFKNFLIGSDQGEVTINPGHYEFPFQMLIPPTAPSSFEGSNGHIRYEVKVVVDRAFKFDQEKCVGLRIESRRDLNADPYCKNPMSFEFEGTFCCWCMNQGLCTVRVNLPQSGYCPEQTIRIEVACENKSNVKIDYLEFELQEKRHFTATNNYATREDKHNVAQLKKGPIPGNTTRNWSLEMDIPNIDVYNLDACKYIKIEHWFKVTMSPSGCHSSSDDKRRLILGHIPLREFGEDSPPPNEVASQEYKPENQSYPTPHPMPTAPYPSGNNSPYPGPLPYPTQPNAGNMPFPSSFPGHNPPYPGDNQTPHLPPPYPGFNPPYPGSGTLPMVSPYPVGSDPQAAAPSQPGFNVLIDSKSQSSAPSLPPTANVPYPLDPAIGPNHYATPSAPEYSTPDVDKVPL